MPEAEALPSVNTVSMYLRWPRCRCTQNNAMGSVLLIIAVLVFCTAEGPVLKSGTPWRWT